MMTATPRCEGLPDGAVGDLAVGGGVKGDGSSGGTRAELERYLKLSQCMNCSEVSIPLPSNIVSRGQRAVDRVVCWTVHMTTDLCRRREAVRDAVAACHGARRECAGDAMPMRCRREREGLRPPKRCASQRPGALAPAHTSSFITPLQMRREGYIGNCSVWGGTVKPLLCKCAVRTDTHGSHGSRSGRSAPRPRRPHTPARPRSHTLQYPTPTPDARPQPVIHSRNPPAIGSYEPPADTKTVDRGHSNKTARAACRRPITAAAAAGGSGS